MQNQIKQIDLERLISKIASEKCRHAKWFIWKNQIDYPYKTWALESRKKRWRSLRQFA
jgi:hypothetical protein